MSSFPSTAAASARPALAKGSIGFWEALAMSVEAMGPILGALSVAPLIAAYAGFSAPFIVLVSGIAMFTVAFTIARFTRVLPSAASIYAYISHGLGERIGFMSAWLSFVYYFLFPPSLMIGLGLYAQSATSFLWGWNVQWYVFAIAGALIAFGLSVLGIKLSMRIDLTLAIIADVVLLAVSVAVIASVIGHGKFTLEPLLPTHAGTGFVGLSTAIAFGVLIFLGFEQSFVLGEEVRDPHGDVPRAIFISLAGIGLILLIATFAMVVAFGVTGMTALGTANTTDGTPFWSMIHTYLSSPWRDALQVVAVTSVLGNLIASHNCIVRIQYGMGRARALPGPLGWTNARYKTPVVAIVFQTCASILIVVVAAIAATAWPATWSATSTFGFISFLEGLAASVAFILIMLAAIRYFPLRHHADGAFKNYIVPAVGIVILIPPIYTSFYPAPPFPLNWAGPVIVAWVLIGALYLIWRESVQKVKIDLDYAFREVGGDAPILETEPLEEIAV